MLLPTLNPQFDPVGTGPEFDVQTNGSLVVPLGVSSLEREYGSLDAPVLTEIAGIAVERNQSDRFQWGKKINGEFFTNSCDTAADNMNTAVIEANLVGENGWQIRKIGTIGTLTTVENAAANTLIAGYETARFWDDSPVPPLGFDVTDPPSYAHTLSILKSPDGRFYTVDTWGNSPEFERVYPVGDGETFFSKKPGQRATLDAEFRLHQNFYGRPWDVVPPDDPGTTESDSLQSPSDPSPTSPVTDVDVVTSLDPNDKLGLLGVGDERYITPDNLFRYTIRFENFATASAPAQEVLVRDTLDLAVLDASTLELGQIRFGDTRVNVPPGRTAFSARVPFGENLEVVITAGLVVETGVLTWRFASVDTETGDLPADPFDGFLPPNQSPPEGEGSVSFRIRSQPGLPDGAVVRNEARIFFDLNEPIDTPPWVNVVDHRAPTSAIAGLDATQADTLFAVEWGGSDGAGSGLAHYDVFVSKDGDPFYLWQRRVPFDSTSFAGERGSTYGFYTIATDQLGNREAPKTEPDAVTAVGVAAEGFAGLPEALTLGAARPNPTAGRATFRYGLPTAGRARLQVYDLLGRRVATLADGDQAAGWHEATLARGLAPGLYVVRLQAGREAQTRKVTVVR